MSQVTWPNDVVDPTPAEGVDRVGRPWLMIYMFWWDRLQNMIDQDARRFPPVWLDVELT